MDFPIQIYILTKRSNRPPEFSSKHKMTLLIFLHLKITSVSCTLDSKDIDKMFNSTLRVPRISRDKAG